MFSPDENASNRLQDIYEASWKTWLAAIKPEDADGTDIAPDGRVMEMLSEHTLEGWLEGYLLTGRHGLFNTYEAFVHIIDSMYNQHAKWLEKSKLELDWRAPISSLNLLITSLVWRQDHNGFTHEDPGFLDVVSNKSAEITRIYLPPDANCLLSVADHCLRSEDYVNVIVADKQPHLVYLDMDAAVIHCTKGIGIWEWASNDAGAEPDVVVASAGDILTQEALAAVAILRRRLPGLEDSLRQRRGSVSPAAGTGTSARTFRSRLRFALHQGQAGDLQLPRISLADPQVHVSQDEPRQHSRARVQGKGQYQYSAGTCDPQSGGSLQPGHRRDRSRPQTARPRRTPQGMAEGADHRKHQLRL